MGNGGTCESHLPINHTSLYACTIFWWFVADSLQCFGMRERYSWRDNKSWKCIKLILLLPFWEENTKQEVVFVTLRKDEEGWESRCRICIKCWWWWEDLVVTHTPYFLPLWTRKEMICYITIWKQPPLQSSKK